MDNEAIARRTLLTGIAATAAVGGFPMISKGRAAIAPGGPVYSTRAIDLVRKTIVIDMLSPLWLLNDLDPAGWSKDLPAQKVADWHASGITAINHAAGIGDGPDAHRAVLTWIAGWNGFVSRHPDHFVGVGRFADIEQAKAKGRIAMICGLQNSEHFRSPEDVKLFHGLGQRVSLLTYNEQNYLGSGSTERVDGGVSDFGAAIIAAMNAVGMLVDVAHCGDRTTLDGIALSKDPIAITHSNCRALIDHPRAKTDEAIKALAAKGGVMGIAAIRPFLTAKDPTTIEDLVDHYDHVIKTVGIEHVGIGSDSDLYGYDALPPEIMQKLAGNYKASYKIRPKNDVPGYDHPRKVYDLTEALIRRGYSNANIELVLGGNFKRLLTRVWR